MWMSWEKREVFPEALFGTEERKEMIVKSEKNEAYQQARTGLESLHRKLNKKEQEVLRLSDEIAILKDKLKINETAQDSKQDEIQKVKAKYIQAKSQADTLHEQINDYDEFQKIAESVSLEAVKSGQKISKGFTDALGRIAALRTEYEALAKAYKPYHRSLNTDEDLQDIIGMPLPDALCIDTQTKEYKAFMENSQEYQVKNIKIRKDEKTGQKNHAL
jgi:chromosome segregation ATPase